MKVLIKQQFGAPPSAIFQIGEVLEVSEEVGKEWVDSGRAVPQLSYKPYKNRPSPFASRKEVATLNKRNGRRETR